MNYSRLASALGVSRTTISDWRNRPLKTEISLESLSAMAKMEGRSVGELQSWLRTGEWLKTTKSPTLEDRVQELEAAIAELLEQSKTSRVIQPDWSMPALSRAIQDAIWVAGMDWRDHSTISTLHQLFTTPIDQGGMGYRKAPEMSQQRLRDIVFGIVETTEPEDAAIAYLIATFTGDDKWTTDYAQGLSEGSISYQSPWKKNGKSIIA
ncbi:MAG: helix-turn-helix transcriptional regulator [Leptolyngbya sp. SIOISBB]|nr:helix-turn-helix transcriptional regulator [Leptolyngbya sp. SIOISBB]